jgi:hypothetical protein
MYPADEYLLSCTCNHKNTNKFSCCLVYIITKVSMNFRENVLSCLVPHLGMKFRNPDESWKFWLAYGGQKGFDVRKHIRTKVRLVARSHPVGLFVLMKVIEGKITGEIK